MENNILDICEDAPDIQKFLELQKSGIINMMDATNASKLIGLSKEKYTDILLHYNEYKTGSRK